MAVQQPLDVPIRHERGQALRQSQLDFALALPQFWFDKGQPE
jgi:hypothetical protein